LRRLLILLTAHGQHQRNGEIIAIFIARLAH
jgi:hypothetical protein